MKTSPILQVNGLTVQLSGKTVLRDITFTVNKGEWLAVIGSSGSGKSTLVKTLSGQCFGTGTIVFANHPQIVTITQQHRFKNLSNLSSFYYQQRFNSSDSEDAVSVNDTLFATGAGEAAIDQVLSLLGITHVQHTKLIQLSNGEHKRFQLAKAVLQNAEWMLLDNPYTGLDIAAREQLNTILDTLAGKGIYFLLVTAPAEIPASVTKVALLSDGVLASVMPRAEFESKKRSLFRTGVTGLTSNESYRSIPPAYTYPDFSVAVRMIDTHVTYNNRKILDGINWEVKKGERWNVSGHNGSGKSTLLSLVNGDNPQAFANEIYLFDRKKGTGESIWEIKQKIGYISPELHHYFDAGISCFEVVASGLFDTIGLFRQLSVSQTNIVNQWMQLLQVEKFTKKLFKQLSNGEQRMVLLARALVKNPPLLILDEPCQGLDSELTADFIALINDICVSMNKTLIYVTHYEEEIPACITNRLKLAQGKIAA